MKGFRQNHQEADGLIINRAIRAEKVQLITEDGENMGVVDIHNALERAQSVGLDLVMLSPRGADGVPVTKIMDHGKELYTRKKKQAEAKKKQKVIQVKEVKMRPKIGDHDYETKMRQTIGFLKDGKHVKLTLCFRGREMVTKQQRGGELFARIEDSFQKHGLTDRLIKEKDMAAGVMWSRIYYLKG